MENTIEGPKPRRTKIVATLGPATDDPAVMQAIIAAGTNVVRLNFSHDPHEKQAMRIALARDAAKSLGKPLGILADLQGPKIRIACFKEKSVVLEMGQAFCFDADLDPQAGDVTQVGLDYVHLPKDVHTGDYLLVDDGRLEFQVTSVLGQKIHCTVKVGGRLSNHKGINRRGGGLSAPPLTEKDKKDLAFIATQHVDYIALSFVKTAQDMIDLKALLVQHGSPDTRLVSKIETTEAIQNIDAIIQVSDAVMIARGDLGVEMGYAELPGLQKDIIHRARSMDKVVITATQMMESMIHSPLPTRAEVSDVANAALDGTDAVMLSAESAVGDFPIEAIKALDSICLAAERQKRATLSRHRMNVQFDRIDESIAMAAMYIANHVNIRVIIALTESGSTPLWMSRIRSSVPIYALSRHSSTCGLMTLFRGVHPVLFDVTQYPAWEISHHAIVHLLKKEVIALKDRVLITKGDIIGVDGGSNTLKILTVTASHLQAMEK